MRQRQTLLSRICRRKGTIYTCQSPKRPVVYYLSCKWELSDPYRQYAIRTLFFIILLRALYNQHAEPFWSRQSLHRDGTDRCGRWSNTGSRLGQRLKRWPNIEPVFVSVCRSLSSDESVAGVLGTNSRCDYGDTAPVHVTLIELSIIYGIIGVCGDPGKQHRVTLYRPAHIKARQTFENAYFQNTGTVLLTDKNVQLTP